MLKKLLKKLFKKKDKDMKLSREQARMILKDSAREQSKFMK